MEIKNLLQKLWNNRRWNTDKLCKTNHWTNLLPHTWH